MKKTLITLCLSLCCVMAFAQSFEGTIVYKNSYKSKMPTVTDQQFTDMMGTTQTWSISGAAYRAELNGQLVQWQVYVPADNKLYTKMANSADALWNDAAENKDEVLSSELHKDVIEILGYKCDELVLNCKSGVQKYYFSKKLGIDARLFSNHKFGNWYAMLSEAGAVPLKTIVDSPQFTIESIATEIKPAKLDKALFVLPAGTTTSKNPY
ncbi:hypothetical protein [Mucilaginibacter gilvus]|uniref:DUF4412 domain-containing protein n=1 Tax=Mucilaginibacter gilvus TaxID=2305909 RepID=A0A3S3Z516_9SPHI|nr:hypothetical protein [Mucilaginibacter gilvus]RWY57463.1 hypothetical protein EPL05_02745 [Mucilaginibacter gilvus]